MGELMSYLEGRIVEFVVAHNSLMDTHNKVEYDIAAIKLKLAELEDRSRRNNIRFRNILEPIRGSQLREFPHKPKIFQIAFNRILFSPISHRREFKKFTKIKKKKENPPTNGVSCCISNLQNGVTRSISSPKEA
ncbi:hypothetical protein GDO78_004919 [Eleutherodactylus coqui]|uniref:Uncharacterized protein n=1 Tax=Eleutherodactylus coqui TaxID=57060 RepID=A0A8J6KEE2_ELECQ|nr:hypothetical protein GDO78_004919 [Eleutherodactylus coqui]